MRIGKLKLFLGLTFLISWSLAIIFSIFTRYGESVWSIVMATAFMFGPMISAILVQKVIYGDPLRKPLGVSLDLNRWFLVAWLLPVLLVLAAIGTSVLIPGVRFTPDMSGFLSQLPPEVRTQVENLPIHYFWISLIGALIAGVTVNAVAAFGEELGWRGLLLKELGHMDFWKTSGVIGLVWGIWHAPLVIQGHNYPQHPVLGVLMMIGWTVLLAPIFSYIRIKSKSVIAASIFHGSLNGSAGLPFLVLAGGGTMLVGITGIAGFVVLLVLNLGIFFFDPSIRNKPVEEFLSPSED